MGYAIRSPNGANGIGSGTLTLDGEHIGIDCYTDWHGSGVRGWGENQEFHARERVRRFRRID
jgi:hypothetical protein